VSLIRTGVGSLPHTDPEGAIEFVRRTTDVPYLPQLPVRNAQESMLVQWGDGIAHAGQDGTALLHGAEAGDRHEAFSGAAAMLQSFDGPILKTQATGPVTLAAALRTGGVRERGLIDLVAEELGKRISTHLGWIRSETAVENIVLVLDEPALAALGADHSELPELARQALERMIDSIDAEVGLHCCGDTDWGGLAEIGFDWLSWDVGALGEGFLRGVDRLAASLGDGTRLMWGIVPTTTGPLPEPHVLLGRYGTAVANLVVAGAPLESLKARAWFTPACGLAGLSVGDAEVVAQVLSDVMEEVESGW
jgi:methionine synthase II (cobalamin-independent)